MQGVLFDQIGADTGQVPLGQRTQACIEQIGDGQTEHRVTQKLQALVMVGRETAVGQCLGQQGDIGKRVLQALLQFHQTGYHVIWIALRI